MTDHLIKEAHKYDFFQAVRLLEGRGAGRPIGTDAQPSQEVARLRRLGS